MRELATDDASQDVKGWLQRAHTYLFQPDIFASVSSNDTLMRIHSTAEEHDKATEELWAPLQVLCGCCCVVPMRLVLSCMSSACHRAPCEGGIEGMGQQDGGAFHCCILIGNMILIVCCVRPWLLSNMSLHAVDRLKSFRKYSLI